MKRFLTAVVVVLTIAAGFAWFAFPPQHSVLSTPFADGTIPGILHVHSTRSDGRGTVDDIARAAAGAGLKFVIVTDHGDGTRAPDRPAYRNGVLCLDAVEISTAEGHYVALGLAKTPYPLGGEARDAVEDVKRLGGFGIVAHPDSPKTDLSWREWSAPFDGIEFVNPDTSWRQQVQPAFHDRIVLPTRLLALRILSYPFRPAESIASLIQPTRILNRWAELAMQRRIVVVGGADAHAQIGLKVADSAQGAPGIPIPSYDASFRAMSVRIHPDRAFTGDANADAAVVMSAIRAGHLYTAVDGAAGPPAFDFTAVNAAGTAREGDGLPAAGPVTLHVRSNAPSGFRASIWNGAVLVSGDHTEPDFSVTAPAGPGVYWVEIRPSGQLSRVPWITSNPVYVGMPAPAPMGPRRAAATLRQPLLGLAAQTNWRVEHDPTSLAALDLPALPPDSAGKTIGQARLRFGLSSGPPAGQFAALVVDLLNGLAQNDRVAFTVRAEQPLRISVQLRSIRSRWQRSVYVDTVDQERVVFFDDLMPVGESDAAAPPPGEIRSILFVIDSVNTKPGTSGRVWITEPRLEH